jgi:RHH-type transcriptional regulator, rel operon repressor / antitoxin RelB
MSDSAVFSVRVSPELKAKVEAIAAAVGRPCSWVVTQALEAFITEQAREIEEIRRGVAEADAGDFASAEEVDAVFAKWTDRD